MWERKLAQQALTMILLFVFLFGCSPAETNLAGTEWELVSLSGKDLIKGTDITLFFTDEYLGGDMSCNGYGGSPDSGMYHATDDGAFALDFPFAVTVQLCSEPEGIMEQETEYIEILMTASHFQIVDNHLEIEDELGDTILIFQRK